MHSNGKQQRMGTAPFLLSLFLTSMSLFVFEVTATRVFSPVLQYHYVFLVVSMAIFGLGIGGVIAYHRYRSADRAQMVSALPGWLLVLSGSFIFTFAVMYKVPFIRFTFVYAAVSALPFIAGGIFISLLFRTAPEKSHLLYFADLIGAGAGSAAVVYFLNRWSVVNTLLIVSSFPVFAGLILTAARRSGRQVVFPAMLLAGFVFLGVSQPVVRQFERRFTSYFTSPLTHMNHLREANQSHSLEDWVWDAFSRTDLVNSTSYPRSKLVTIDGGSTSEMIQFNGDLSSVAYLTKDLNYMPFVIGSSEKVLLIGPGGGKDIVLSLLGGSKDIHAVEINPGTIQMARKHAPYNGSIYDRDEVTLHIQDGRNFVRQSTATYDMIYLAQVMSEVAGTIGYALAENFIYTTEAIGDYWHSLEAGGRLAFVLHGEYDLMRLMRTVRSALQAEGITEEQLKTRMLVAGRGHGHEAEKIHMPVIIVQKSHFTGQEIGRTRSWVNSGGYELLYVPDGSREAVWEKYMNGGLVNRASNGRIRELVLSPTTDDRPYFWDFTAGVEKELLFILAAVGVLSLVFFRPPLRKKGLRMSPFYFIGLGVGFMLIEIPLIQQFTLFLGHPTRSFITTMLSLLLGGALGSLNGGWKRFRWKKRYLPLCLVPLLTAAVYTVFRLFIVSWTLPSPLLRMAVIGVLTFPIGYFMGMPFPFGLKALKGKKLDSVIPLMWGINGTMSVGGSVLAVIVSMKLGFSYALMMGSAAYMALFLFMPLYERGWGVDQ